MRTRMTRSRLWMRRATLLLGFLMMLTATAPPGPAKASLSISRDVMANGMSERVTLDVAGATENEAAGLLLSFGQSKGGGWEQRFEKVNGYLDLRVGGPNGTLIYWEGRGVEGKYTWKSSDPMPDTRSLTKWVGNGYEIRLWARIVPDGSSKPLCYMDTTYNGDLRQRWEFYEDEDHVMKR